MNEPITQQIGALHSLVWWHGRTRIKAYEEYHAKYCSSDASMRRLMRKKMPPRMKFQRAKYPIGSVVKGTMWPGLYLVVGHSFTGLHGQERGCVGCKITDRIFKKWQWVGPDKTLMLVSMNGCHIKEHPDEEKTWPRMKAAVLAGN